MLNMVKSFVFFVIINTLLSCVVALSYFPPPKRSKWKPKYVSDNPSKLCNMESELGKPYRFHRESKRCYMVGERGPCPDLMEFVSEDQNYGVCDCDTKSMCGRPLVYWPMTKRCYYINDRGPCPPGKWLTFGFNLSPVCKRNPCQEQQRDNPSRGGRFWFSFRNQCYMTYSQGYCKKGEILFNNAKEYRPTCNTHANCTMLAMSTTAMTCLPGSKKDYDGKCTRRYIHKY